MGLESVSIGAFYEQHPDLKVFDNGNGLFSIALSGRVSMDEFTAYGRDLAGCAFTPEAVRRKKAADSLIQTLHQKPPQVVRYFLEDILEENVARYVKREMGVSHTEGAFHLFSHKTRVRRDYDPFRNLAFALFCASS